MGHNVTVGYASIYCEIHLFLTALYCKPNCSSPFAARDRIEVSLEQFSFLEKIFNKTKLKERTWAKLVNLDTLYWYCDEPELTIAARRYNAQVHQCKSVTLSFCYAYFHFLNAHPLSCRNGCCQENGLY